jgi:hypothetical protein
MAAFEHHVPEIRKENFGRLPLDHGNKFTALAGRTMKALLFSARPRQFHLILPFSAQLIAGEIFRAPRDKESAKCDDWVHCCTLHRPASDASSPKSSPLRLRALRLPAHRQSQLH